MSKRRDRPEWRFLRHSELVSRPGGVCSGRVGKNRSEFVIFVSLSRGGTDEEIARTRSAIS